MAWFKNNKKGIQLEEWDIKDEDFLVDSLVDHDSPHLKSILLDVKEIVPENYYDRVFVGGGFASHLAGITSEHGDVDIFCLTEGAFNVISQSIIRHKDPFCYQRPIFSGNTKAEVGPLMVTERGYGRILKFSHSGVNYDLVDSTLQINLDETDILSPPQKPDILTLLRVFDLNWCMVAIDLAADTITCHVDALSNKPKVNPARLDFILDGIISRVERYRDRLVKTPDKNECKAVLVILKHMLKEQKKAGKRMADPRLTQNPSPPTPPTPKTWY